jgi:hypothetical protein
MHKLSFKFAFPWIRHIAIIVSVIVNIILLIKLVAIFYNINDADKNTFIGMLIMITFIILSSYYDYFLYISKTIYFDNTHLHIMDIIDKGEKIEISTIVEVRRKMHYFYYIKYKSSVDNFRVVYFFISPNPPFTKPDNVKLLLSAINGESA